jgi:predicted ATPase
MTATVGWSYDLLDREEQRALQRVSVLPGRFPAEAAAWVLSGRSSGDAPANDALSVLSALVDKSLLIVTPPVGNAPALSDV